MLGCGWPRGSGAKRNIAPFDFDEWRFIKRTMESRNARVPKLQKATGWSAEGHGRGTGWVRRKSWKGDRMGPPKLMKGAVDERAIHEHELGSLADDERRGRPNGTPKIA